MGTLVGDDMDSEGQESRVVVLGVSIVASDAPESLGKICVRCFSLSRAKDEFITWSRSVGRTSTEDDGCVDCKSFSPSVCKGG